MKSLLHLKIKLCVITRKCYNSNPVLLNLLEGWEKSLDNKNIVGAAPMFLSKAFYCIIWCIHRYRYIPIIILKAKETRCKNSQFWKSFRNISLWRTERINIRFHSLQYIYILSDLFVFITEVKLANFADDNTIYAERKDIQTWKILNRSLKSDVLYYLNIIKQIIKSTDS